MPGDRLSDRGHCESAACLCDRVEGVNVERMFHKITVSLAPGREYAAYVNGNELEVVARIDGHSAHLGRARWDGRSVSSDGAPLRADVKLALGAAIVEAISRDQRVAMRCAPEFEGGY